MSKPKILSDAEIKFISEWYDAIDNRDLAEIMGYKLQFLRKKLYELGYYRMRLDYWTDEQINFLKENYKGMGDLEISEIFQRKFPKSKPWTIKHIEKKRKYLGLRRTDRQLFNIRLRNIDQGRMDGLNWSKKPIRRMLRYGTCIIRNINGYKVKLVRVKGGFKKLAHINYEKQFGPIPKGHMIIMKDGNSLNCEVENLELVTRTKFAEMIRETDGAIAWVMSMSGKAMRNGTRKDAKLHRALMKRPDLLEAKRQQLRLQRLIKTKDNEY